MVNRNPIHSSVVALAVVSVAILVLARPVPAQDSRHPVQVTVTAQKYSFTPARIEVQQDDIVQITLKSADVPHSFTIDKPYYIAKRVAPGHSVTFEFHADTAGTFTYYCNITTDDKCKEMKGQLVVRARK